MPARSQQGSPKRGPGHLGPGTRRAVRGTWAHLAVGLAIAGCVGVGTKLVALHAADVDTLRAELLAAYATRPQGYSTEPRFAPPDRSVPFRWHAFRDEAVRRFDDVPMTPFVAPHNPLEDAGASVEVGSGVTIGFVPEHATEGENSLRVVCPSAAIVAGKSAVRIAALAGGPSPSSYLKGRGLLATASCYGPHFRRIEVDVFNPQPHDVRVAVCGVPFVVRPGASTISVRTVDAVDRGYACAFNAIPVRITGPTGPAETTLFLDHVRLVQEIPKTIAASGRMFQFAARAEAHDPPLTWPGFVPIEADSLYDAERGFGWTKPKTTRQSRGHSFRSYENGLLWGCCLLPDAPLRVDVPRGRWGLWLFAAPNRGYRWEAGAELVVNGARHPLLAPRAPDEVRRTALSGEAWDYRPGQCVWEQLVRPVYYPELPQVEADAPEGRLEIEFPATFALHALVLFPAETKSAAEAELGRLNYLLAESRDVSHPWIKGPAAVALNYLGRHAEQLAPESIPERLAALDLGAEDFERGLVPFVRGLVEPVHVDTIPTREEAAVRALRCRASLGERECVGFGLLPLRETAGLRVEVGDLVHESGATRIPRDRIDVRLGRQHQKTMQFGHHNHDYAYEEHYLVRRPTFDLHPAAARRVYVDLAVPDEARPGRYVGRVSVVGRDGRTRTEWPWQVEVLPLRLERPRPYLASSFEHPELSAWGFDVQRTSRDRAIELGLRGYAANLGYEALRFDGKLVDWSTFLAEQERLAPLIAAGVAGRAPRGFFGGPAPGTHGRPDAREMADRFFAEVRAAVPQIDLLGRDVPAFHFRQGKQSFQIPHEWIVLSGPTRPDEPEAFTAAAAGGRPFWFFDGLRHSKEHAARFTFGPWLWRSGASGRYTTLDAALQYGGGTARESFAHDPYFTLLDVTTCNIDRALMPAPDGGTNPCRDLLLLREGIDDLRYLATLENRLESAARKTPDSVAVRAGRALLEELCRDVPLDLAETYTARSGAYGENWYVRPDSPWNSAKFDATRTRLADAILRLDAEAASDP